MAINAADTNSAEQHVASMTVTLVQAVPVISINPRPTDGQMYPRGDGSTTS